MQNVARDGERASPSASAEKLPAEDIERNRSREAGPTKGPTTTGPSDSGVIASAKEIGRQLRDGVRNAVRHGLFHKPIGPSKDGRHVRLRVVSDGKDLHDDSALPPLIDERRGHAYLSNAIRTSRYTLWDFAPKQLWFQFTRLNNFYFLCVGIPQTIPGISTTGNFTTILPLLFFVLLTILKEGYDDYKRHRLDKVENAREATVLRRSHAPITEEEETAVSSQPTQWWRFGRRPTAAPKREPAGGGLEWRAVEWRDVEVGDIVKLSRDEDVPADVVLLYAKNEEHIAYVETMSLDGETNLKSKFVPAALQGLGTVSELAVCGAEFVLEDPNPDLYNFEGRLIIKDGTSPLTLNEVLYRGCTLRNTPFAFGLVINTGEECKIRKNANRHPKAKKPALEKVTNRIVISLVVYVISLTAGCSIGYMLWQRYTELRSWYLEGAAVAAQEIIVGYAIHFNNLIPLSLWVTLEITKVFQMLMLNDDIEMYDETSDTPARCNTNTILENLGQIGYVFSDKTGTLTENVMKLRKLSIAGTSWLHAMDLQAEEVSKTAGTASTTTKLRDKGRHSRPKTAASSSTWSPVEQRPSPPKRSSTLKPLPEGRRSIDIPEEEEGGAISTNPGPSSLSPAAAGPSVTTGPLSSPSVLSPASNSNRRSSSQWRSTARPDHVQPELTTEDLLEYIRTHPSTPFAKAAVDYLVAMALCHTCLPETNDGGEIEYQAASPDELALVKAAQELGFMVIQRTSQSITLRVTAPQQKGEEQKQREEPEEQEGERQGEEQVYEIMDVIEFSSKRKRMSIVVRCPDGRLLLICKGADSAILPRLKMAHLAIQKAGEVRKSADLERQLLRRSEQLERTSIGGGRASLTLVRRSLGAAAEGSSSMAVPSTKRPSANDRSKSFEAGSSLLRRSMDLIRPALKIRTLSFDVHNPQPAAGPSPSIVLSPPPPLSPQRPDNNDKFAFLSSTTTDSSTVFTRCFKHLDDFASEGLRTLLYSQRHIPEAEYASWRDLYCDATTSLVDRQERVEGVGELLERDLELVGASAIEDKLQRGVPETIDRLRRANIKIWMLTGDKRETAVNIAHSARIAKPHSDVYVLDVAKGDVRDQLVGVVEELREHVEEARADGMMTRGGGGGDREEGLQQPHANTPGGGGDGGRSNHHTVVVVDGHTLSAVEASPSLSDLFFSVAAAVDSVICCRASPAQKALLVRTVRRLRDSPSSSATNNKGRGGLKRGLGRGLTLSIGDGGNDLAMLSAAHVGVGISGGHEGLQAARVADYSIAQFRFLGRLLLVHGRWNYARTARFVLATFWKEMFFYTGTVAYQNFVGYTGTSLYEMWSLTVLNVLFTSLCTIAPALWEQDLRAETLLAVPELYGFGQRGEGLNVWRYGGWMVAAAGEGVVVFFACWAGAGVFGLVGDTGLYALGNLVFSVAIMWTNWKLLIIETHHKNSLILGSFFVTVAGWWAWQAFLSAIYSPSPSPYAVKGGLAGGFGRDLSWWVCLIVVVMGLIVAETAYKAVKRQLVVSGVWAWTTSSLGNFVGGCCCLPRWFLSVGGGAAWAAKGGDVERLDLELWQELEQDPEVRARLERMCRLQDEDDSGGGDRDGCDAEVRIASNEGDQARNSIC